MRENYEAIILEDHAFCEQHDIEYALWQLHYRRIEELRAHLNAAVTANVSATSQGAKSSLRPDRITKIRSQFKTFLSEATGFYHDLMLKIRAKYGLPLSSFPDDQENKMVKSKGGNKSAEMKKGLISCHRCLIYLGDLSRYKGLYGEADSKSRDFAAASSYYLQASSLWPSSGNPHHQLSILASYSGDELLSIYRYFRSLAVDNPFSTARDNLIIAFEKNRQNFSQLLGDGKASTIKTARVRTPGKGRGKGGAVRPLKDDKTDAIKESQSSIPDTFKAFSIRFVRLNGVLFTRTSLETFVDVFSVVISDFLELLSSGQEDVYNFGASATENGLMIVRLISILIFTVYNVNRESENQSYAEMLQRSVLLQNAYTATFEFMGHILQRCMQLHDPTESYLLPGVLIFLEWLACHPEIAGRSEVEEKEATARSSFWNNCISFLNKLLSSGFMSINEDKDETCFFNMSRYDEGEIANLFALWEDYELRGFLPLVPAQMILDFSRKQVGSDGSDKEKKARFQRIIAAGKSLVSVVRVGQEYMYFDPRLKNFAIGAEPQISDDFGLPSSLEMPASNGLEQEPREKKMNVGVFPPKAQLYAEGEEEDEVIVFQPFVAYKHANFIDPELSSYDALVPGGNDSQGDMGSCDVSVSAPLEGRVSGNALDSNLGPNALNAQLGPPTSLATILPQHVQSFQPSTSKWLLEQQARLASGLNKLNRTENGVVVKPGLREHFGVLQHAALSLPFPHSVNTSSGNEFAQGFDAGIPSKFDSIMSTGASFDSLSLNPSSTLAASLRKNPVSRPLRHFGPPPGFKPVAPNLNDESLSDTTLKDETSQLDDYRWLDGYQMPSSANCTRFDNSINHTPQSYHQASKGNMGMISFPFPGKRVPTSQVQVENQMNWQEYQAPDPLKAYQVLHQQKTIKMNQDFIPLPKQYQGQSIWDDRFFV
ncbi:nonsense-mediated mRNA decay factor SMG7 isoform X2 [Quercus suber]